ncbi:hypothetical protein FRC01_000569 [Tulasnella sp. 417]|nr:hypothetical protein FRC01_000569 [Tulasnella sp. 417]
MTSGTQNPTFVSTSLVDLPYEAVLEVTEVGELDVISRLALRHHDDGRFGAHFSQDYQVGNVQGDPSPGVIAQDGLGIALVHSSEGKGVYLIVADSARRANLTIATGLDTNKQWDVVVSGIAILLFSELANDVFFAVYSNLRALLPSSGGLAVERQPEITGLRTYGSPQDSLTEDLSWYTVHPWDTPHWQTDNLVPVLFEASRLDWEDDTEWRSIVGIHWLSPAQVIRSLESGEPMPRETRHIKHLRDECMQAELDGATMLVPSTYGRRLLWVNHPVEPDDYNPEPRLETITLQTPWRSTINENDSSTRFHVPLDLNLTHRIDFDDEHGRLLIITDPTGDEGYQTAHIFTY